MSDESWFVLVCALCGASLIALMALMVTAVLHTEPIAPSSLMILAGFARCP